MDASRGIVTRSIVAIVRFLRYREVDRDAL